MPSVLFVCTGNEYRSPVAAAYFHKLLQLYGCASGWSVGSAGTWPSSQRALHPDAIKTALSLGLKIEGHHIQTVSNDILHNHDLILTMEKGHKEAIGFEFPFTAHRVFLLSEMVNEVPFDIQDPGMFPGRAVQILNEMCNLIQQGFPQIKQLAERIAEKYS